MTNTRAGLWAVWLAPVGLAMLTTSCGGTPATPEQRRLAERAYLAPFLQNTRVVCEQLEVEITPNFHLHVSNPGVDKRHQRFDREQKPALVEKTWRNLTGDRRAWFTVTVSEPSDPETPRIGKSPGTTYTVMNQFTLRIRERGEMTLSARAYGGIVLVEEAGGQPQQPHEYTIVNGVVKR